MTVVLIFDRYINNNKKNEIIRLCYVYNNNV